VDPKVLEQGQRPWAAVLTCSDSRIPLEWIFGVGDGEVVGVRSAGNTAFSEGIASLEYAVAELQVPVILIMGHSGCGAVKAALSPEQITSPLLRSLVDQIRSNVETTNNLEQAIKANVKASAEQINSRSALLSEAIQNKRVAIRPAYFDIDLGTVRLLD
jgi:carbonic anhydrase